MAQWLTVSRAAHLVGATRAELQKHIAAGALPACDGMIATEDLLRLYPEVRLEDSGVFERTVTIREEAFGKRVRERVLPNQEVLAERLAAQSEELADVRRHLARYHDLVEALRERIDRLAAAWSSEPLAELGRLLDEGLAGVLGSAEPANALAVMDDVLRVLAAHVTVKPSGREFFVAGSETVLEAALHAGLAPSYGCGNGNCGLCKARIVSGRLKQVKSGDYPLSPGERAQGYALLCAHTAVSDLVVELLEANSPDDIPRQEIVARVKSVAPLTPDILLLHLRTTRTSRLRYLAGQRAALSVSGATAVFGGEYPIASCPCDDRDLLFHIRRPGAGEEDEFARRLFAGVFKPRDAVSVCGPFGDFVLRRDSANDLAFVVCDTGFAPARSLIEHAVAAGAPGSLRLVWAATRPDGHYLENQCRAWAAALDTFSYATLNAADEAAAGSAAAALAGADLRRCDAYVAGPAAFVETAGRALLAAGLPTERLRAELA